MDISDPSKKAGIRGLDNDCLYMYHYDNYFGQILNVN